MDGFDRLGESRIGVFVVRTLIGLGLVVYISMLTLTHYHLTNYGLSC